MLYVTITLKLRYVNSFLNIYKDELFRVIYDTNISAKHVSERVL